MLRTKPKIQQWMILILAALAITACGGGGGGGGSQTPQFAFTAKTDRALSTVVTSNASTVTNIGNAAAVSIQNGEYAIDGGNFVSSAGTISEGESIVVRGTSSAEFSESVTVTLTIKETSKTFVITTAAQDTTPEDFSFTPQTGAELSTEYFSNTVTVTGITGDVGISVENGTYQINEAAATSEPGTITSGSDLIVAGMSSSEFATTTTVTVTIGETAKTFDITTAAMDITPDVITFTPATGVGLSTVSTSDAVAVSGINSAAPISVTGDVTYSIDGGEFTGDAGTINNGQTVAVRGTTAATNATTTDFTVSIGGVNHVYSVTTVADSTPPTAAIVFPTKVSLTDGATLTVRGTAEDLSGIESVMVTVMNGDTQVSQVAATSFEDEGFARWTAEVTLAVDAVNTVAVSVTDAATNTNSDADSVAVTHSSDYFALEFPEGDEGLSPSSNVYIELDTKGERIFYEDSTLIMQVQLSTGVSSEFVPRDNIFFDSIGGMKVYEDMLLFTDQNGGRLYKTPLDEVQVDIFSDSGNTNSDIGIEYPTDLAITDSGLIYISDGGVDAVYTVELSSGDRTLVSSATRPEDGGALFAGPSSITFRKNSPSEAFIVDANLNELIEVDILTGFRSIILGEIDLQKPRTAVMSHDDSSVYIVDEILDQVIAFDVASQAMSVLIDGSTGYNNFKEPRGLVLDNSNNLLFFTAGEQIWGCTPLYVVDLETMDRIILNKAECFDPF